MTNRDAQELRFPLGGVSENVGFSDQEPGTTGNARNVRGVDPKTGRLRGAQRAGFTRFLGGFAKADGTKVDHVAEVGYQIDLIDYTQRTDGQITKEDSHLSTSKAEAFSPQTDRLGNVYYLDRDDAIVVLNSELDETATITLPLEESDVVCRSIVVDERDYVYAAAGTPSTFKAGKVWRFSRDDDTGRWKVDWEYELNATVTRLLYSGGILFVGQRDKTGDKDRSQVTALNVIAGEPILMWTKGVPDPLGGLGVLPKSGDLLVTSPYNEDRSKAATDGNFSTQSIDGTPYDFIANPDERIFSWGDVETLEGKSFGDPVTRLPDARFASVWQTDYSASLPTDNTDRFLHRHKSVKNWRQPPTYDTAAFGPKPGLRFDGEVGNVLGSRNNRQGENKASVDAKLDKNAAIVPGVKGATWMLAFVARIAPSVRPSCLFATRVGPMKFAVVANADHTFVPAGSGGAPTGGAQGEIVLWSSTALTGTVHTTANTTDSWDWVTNGSKANDVATVLVCIVKDGATSEFRINGNSVDVFGWTEDEMHSPNRQACGMFGSPQILRGPIGSTVTVTSEETQYDENGVPSKVQVQEVDPSRGAQVDDPFGSEFVCDPMDGVLGDYVCVLGSTVTNPHDNGFTANEVDALEGYLAHKFGIQHLLPAGHNHVSTPPSGVYGGGAFASSDHLATIAADPVTAKYAASSGALMWALNGPGMGLAVAANEDGDVFTYGDRQKSLRESPSSTAEVSPIALKLIDEGTRVEAGTKATGTLTFTANVTTGDQVEINGKTYTFLTTPVAAYDVDVGANCGLSIINLVRAINRAEDGRGTDYIDVTKNAAVDASTTAVAGDASGTLVVTAVKAGASENSVTTTDPTDAGGVMSWGGATLAGGDAKSTWTVTANADNASSWPPETPDVGYEHLAAAGAAFQIGIDDEGDAYFTKNSLSGTGSGIYKYPKGADDATSGDVTLDWKWTSSYSGSPTVAKYTGIAFPPTHPDYGIQTVTGPLFAYITVEGPEGLTSLSTSDSTLQKIRLVTEARSSADSPRGKRLLAVSGTDVSTFTKDGSFTSVGTGQLVASPYIGGFTVGHFHVLYDGTQSRLYDARLSTIRKYVAKEGEVPARIVLGTGWRGRAAVVSSDDPAELLLSKSGDILDWNFYPDVPTYEQAIRLTANTSIGKLPDQIQAIYALDKERLLIGGDHSLNVLIGDPAAVALGDFGKSTLSLISDQTGIAFGQQSVCKDPQGVTYFFGSRGSVFALAGGLERISLNRIERRLQDVDLAVYKPALAWDWRREGLVIALVHRGTGGVAQDRYFWEKKTASWWIDDSANTDLQPSCLAVLDGDDPDDRHLVYGTEGGRILFEDESNATDDGSRILSYVDLGPFEIGGAGSEGKIKALEAALADDQGSLEYEVYVSDIPEMPADPVVTGTLERGHTIRRLRARGAYLWLRLRNGAVNERWAVERLLARLAPAGRRRVRT